MLFTPEGELISKIPHHGDYVGWVSRLTADELRAIEYQLDDHIDQEMGKGTEVLVSGWIPGADWTGKAWDLIYTKACQRSEGAAALCWGLIVWKVFMDRDEDWSFLGDVELSDGTQIRSKVYFRIDRSGT